ncbi:D-alanyl-D-alanine carboxypeptidase [Lederbergia galactosidilyticus]|uniref:D-alanyl-D-alanine carboxypeptidase family protein n=1 Tax=Lederbergia galactosidilytica TaxID=217031 RepID=UPI001AE5659A|nr:D-alanyl-D-alanine carboxypeptidase family protein [Lederbergia galactosidilytica]MBP1914676.1 D-alanyl-D-alanine carboxypeptidase [Lederbergia galactosidilytica]
MKARKRILVVIVLVMFFQLGMLPKKAKAVSVSASAAILMDQETGRVLYEHNANETHRIASITKVMTAVLAIESGKMDETTTVSKRAIYTEGSSIYLQQGEKIKLEDLVYGLMLRSGNDAATAIAEHIGGSVEGFVFLMNQKAAEIGMTHTAFANPHGLDDHEEHYSTAYDMALLTRYAMMNPKFQEISGTKSYTLTRENGAHKWKNKNRLLTEKYEYCTGGKTGFTKRAGRTLITTATKENKDLIAVTLNAPDDWTDHISMYEYGFKTYSQKTILSKGSLALNIKEMEGKNFFLKDSIVYPLSEEEVDKVRMEYKLLPAKQLKSLQKGKAGIAIMYLQDEPVKKEIIYLKEEDPESENLWDYFKKLMFSRADAHD